MDTPWNSRAPSAFQDVTSRCVWKRKYEEPVATECLRKALETKFNPLNLHLWNPSQNALSSVFRETFLCSSLRAPQTTRRPRSEQPGRERSFSSRWLCGCQGAVPALGHATRRAPGPCRRLGAKHTGLLGAKALASGRASHRRLHVHGSRPHTAPVGKLRLKPGRMRMQPATMPELSPGPQAPFR